MHPIDALGPPLAVIVILVSFSFFAWEVVLRPFLRDLRRERADLRSLRNFESLKHCRGSLYKVAAYTEFDRVAGELQSRVVFHDWDQDHWA